LASGGGDAAVEFGNLDLEGVEEAVRWAGAEGWEPGLTDATAFFAADPGGFFRADLDGGLAATLSAVTVSDSVAFVGFYIVRPELRGRGIGKALWDEVLAGFGNFTLAADAVPAQVPNYESDGFTVAYRNSRYAGEVTDREFAPIADRIMPAVEVEFEQLVAFDAAHCFGPRPAFLEEWIEGEGREAVVAVNEGSISGFAASRRTGLGIRVGPVFASEAGVARALILSLARESAERIAVDVPMPNLLAIEMLTELGLTPEFETARIYRGGIPELPLDRVFGITSLELG
jgi:GNAT superfamily N-acetyltransferase